MDKDRFDLYIQEGDNRETATCKSILDGLKAIYTDINEINCDECPGRNECASAFISIR